MLCVLHMIFSVEWQIKNKQNSSILSYTVVSCLSCHCSWCCYFLSTWLVLRYVWWTPSGKVLTPVTVSTPTLRWQRCCVSRLRWANAYRRHLPLIMPITYPMSWPYPKSMLSGYHRTVTPKLLFRWLNDTVTYIPTVIQLPTNPYIIPTYANTYVVHTLRYTNTIWIKLTSLNNNTNNEITANKKF